MLHDPHAGPAGGQGRVFLVMESLDRDLKVHLDLEPAAARRLPFVKVGVGWVGWVFQMMCLTGWMRWRGHRPPCVRNGWLWGCVCCCACARVLRAGPTPPALVVRWQYRATPPSLTGSTY